MSKLKILNTTPKLPLEKEDYDEIERIITKLSISYAESMRKAIARDIIREAQKDKPNLFSAIFFKHDTKTAIQFKKGCFLRMVDSKLSYIECSLSEKKPVLKKIAEILLNDYDMDKYFSKEKDLFKRTHVSDETIEIMKKTICILESLTSKEYIKKYHPDVWDFKNHLEIFHN